MWSRTAVRHGRAAVRHGRRAYGPLGSRLRGSIEAWELGEHAGAVQFPGGVAVGEFHRRRTVEAASPVSLSLTGGVS